MSHQESLPQIVESIRPHLETELSRNDPSLIYFGMESSRLLHLQLRIPVCGIASRALQAVLRDGYDINTQLVGITTDIIPSYSSEDDPHQHVRLQTDEHVIDPSFGQYMGLFGLCYSVAKHYNLADLYPDERIAVYPLNHADQFAENFADHGHARIPLIPMPPYRERVPYGVLRNASLDQSIDTMQTIWNPGEYVPHKLQRMDWEHDIQTAAECMAKAVLVRINS